MLPDKVKTKYEITLNQNREILKNPVVLSKLTDLESRVCFNSLTTQIISMSDQELIKYVSNLAKFIARDAGIHGGVDQYEVTRFMDILKKYYRELTIEEVKMAFEFCIVGELDMYLPKDKHGEPDKNHYQVFSIEYVTKVLNAYRKRREQVWSKVIKSLPEKSHVTTDDERKEIDHSIRLQIRTKYLNYRDFQKVPVFYVHIAIFLVLKEIGVISSLEYETSKESYEKAMLQFLKDENPVKRKSGEDFKDSGTISEILHNRATVLEADREIIKIFDKMISNKVDIDKLLNM